MVKLKYTIELEVDAIELEVDAVAKENEYLKSKDYIYDFVELTLQMETFKTITAKCEKIEENGENNE